MKKHPEKYWLGLMVILLVIFLAALVGNISLEGQAASINSASLQEDDCIPISSKTKIRENIVFILGEDKNVDNPYYAEALRYYQLQEKDSIGRLVTHCRSLEEVRSFLAQHKAYGLPWGKVQLVMHANEFNGLGVPLFDGGKRATVQALESAISNNTFESLSDEVLDKDSELVLLGCGLGRNQQALDAIKVAFGGTGELPKVTSTKSFVLYRSESYKGYAYSSEKYEADYWYAFYKTGYRPGDIRLSRQLSKRYPDATIDWRDALTRTETEGENNSWHYTFKIPIVWWETYENDTDRPDLTSKAAQQDWLSEQEELQNIFEDYGIPSENFQWTFRETDYEFEDGSRYPAVKAIGLCTVLCVLETGR